MFLGASQNSLASPGNGGQPPKFEPVDRRKQPPEGAAALGLGAPRRALHTLLGPSSQKDEGPGYPMSSTWPQSRRSDANAHQTDPANDITLGLRTVKAVRKRSTSDKSVIRYERRVLLAPEWSKLTERRNVCLRCEAQVEDIVYGQSFDLSRTRNWGAFKGPFFAGVFSRPGGVVEKMWKRGFAARLFEPSRGQGGNVMDSPCQGRFFTAARRAPGETWTSAVVRSGGGRGCAVPSAAVEGARLKEKTNSSNALGSTFTIIESLYQRGITWMMLHPASSFPCDFMQWHCKSVHLVLRVAAQPTCSWSCGRCPLVVSAALLGPSRCLSLQWKEAEHSQAARFGSRTGNIQARGCEKTDLACMRKSTTICPATHAIETVFGQTPTAVAKTRGLQPPSEKERLYFVRDRSDWVFLFD